MALRLEKFLQLLSSIRSVKLKEQVCSEENSYSKVSILSYHHAISLFDIVFYQTV